MPRAAQKENDLMSDRDEKTEAILNALRTVADPATGRDLVSSGFVKNVTHCDGAVKASLSMGAAPTVIDAVQQQAEEALRALTWATEVRIEMQTTAPPTGTPAQQGPESSASALPGIQRIIAVASGKGGVGKSTIAVNLAAGLARTGAKVGLLDADVYGPSIPTMLGVQGNPAVVEKGGRQMLEPMRAHGVSLMSMGFLVEEDKPIIWRGPMLHGALKQFFNDVAWGELDYLVVDLPPGTGDVALTMVQTISLAGAVIVSTPQNVAMIDAKKAVAMFGQTGVPILGIVENMSGEVFGSGGCQTWAAQEGVRFLGSVPLVADIRQSGDDGDPAVLGRNVEVSGAFMGVVEIVASALAGAGGPDQRPHLSIRR
jgi:ATP-binding protein involved in chromosome partitioning